MGQIPTKQASDKRSVVNDFCITFSTVNGSGSATANVTLLRALFKMGIPVSGKNIFPSNIQGLPTWYTIRLNKNGHLARVDHDDIVVAMNPSTIAKEIGYIVPGGVLFYSDDIHLPEMREDITIYPMPIKKLIKEADLPANLRGYIANMVYVGILAQILEIDLEKVHLALDFHFKGRKNAVDSNYNIVQTAATWARENLVKQDPYKVETMKPLDGYIMADGNTAAAIGAIYGGMQFAAWYPITPATSLAEALNEYLPILRKDKTTGKVTYAVVQAEDELAAIGMSIGAGWAGLRSFTSTSGPGLSLMAEYLGLAYFAEIPVVVWDVQRVGPSTGMPTRTAQGDLTFANFISHGDTQNVILIPGTVNECFEFAWKAFDIAERLQTPVIVLTDLDLGMNQWMTGEYLYPDRPMDRGKVLWEADLEKILKADNGIWGRYLDKDGDGIPYRTLPGNQHQRSGYFGRGTGHDEYANYSEEPEVWERLMARIKKKLEMAKSLTPAPIIEELVGAKFGIIAMGSTDPAVEEARELLKQDGHPTDYLRIRAVPFNQTVMDFISAHDRNYVVEVNRDGQLKSLLTIEFPEQCSRLISTCHLDGLPLTARWIFDQVAGNEEKQNG